MSFGGRKLSSISCINFACHLWRKDGQVHRAAKAAGNRARRFIGSNLHSFADKIVRIDGQNINPGELDHTSSFQSSP